MRSVPPVSRRESCRLETAEQPMDSSGTISSETKPISRFLFDTVVLQPTSLCNLDCAYCYLPNRDQNRRMSRAVAQAVASFLTALPRTPRPFKVLWHWGEPLAAGIGHIETLFEPFAELERGCRVVHRLQTNGTLIDERWCAFFQSHPLSVGVSLDGPAWANREGVDRRGAASFDRIVHGISALKCARIPFGVLAVVGEEALERGADLYRFFALVGCERLDINTEAPGADNQDRRRSTTVTARVGSGSTWRKNFSPTGWCISASSSCSATSGMPATRRTCAAAPNETKSYAPVAIRPSAGTGTSSFCRRSCSIARPGTMAALLSETLSRSRLCELPAAPSAPLTRPTISLARMPAGRNASILPSAADVLAALMRAFPEGTQAASVLLPRRSSHPIDPLLARRSSTLRMLPHGERQTPNARHRSAYRNLAPTPPAAGPIVARSRHSNRGDCDGTMRTAG
jgi:hypothetical protein